LNQCRIRWRIHLEGDPFTDRLSCWLPILAKMTCVNREREHPQVVELLLNKPFLTLMYRECFVSTRMYNMGIGVNLRSQKEIDEMTNAKLFAIKYLNSTTLRLVYVLLALLALAIAGGAPDGMGGSE
jgi:hypothetical protein